jgi:hypothetical protein
MPAGARRAALPTTLRPMLTTMVTTPPAGDDWIHEIKYDGYRMLARIARGRCTLFSRNGRDWTAALPQVARDLARLPVRQDGRWRGRRAHAHGRSRFQLLQNALAAPKVRRRFRLRSAVRRRRRPARRHAGRARACAAWSATGSAWCGSAPKPPAAAANSSGSRACCTEGYREAGGLDLRDGSARATG